MSAKNTAFLIATHEVRDSATNFCTTLPGHSDASRLWPRGELSEDIEWVAEAESPFPIGCFPTSSSEVAFASTFFKVRTAPMYHHDAGSVC